MQKKLSPRTLKIVQSGHTDHTQFLFPFQAPENQLNELILASQIHVDPIQAQAFPEPDASALVIRSTLATHTLDVALSALTTMTVLTRKLAYVISASTHASESAVRMLTVRLLTTTQSAHAFKTILEILSSGAIHVSAYEIFCMDFGDGFSHFQQQEDIRRNKYLCLFMGQVA